jgi:hypothetical protein
MSAVTRPGYGGVTASQSMSYAIEWIWRIGDGTYARKSALPRRQNDLCAIAKRSYRKNANGHER